MSFKLHQKQVFEPITGIIICTIMLLLAVWFIKAQTLSLVVNIKVPGNDYTKVYYDCGRGFNEQDAVKQDIIHLNAFNKLIFELPDKNITQLRIDPATKIGEIEIKSIELRSGFKRHKWLPENIIKDFVRNNQLQRYEVKNGAVSLESTGSDPYMVYNPDMNALVSSVKLDKRKLYIGYLIVAILVGGTLWYYATSYGIIFIFVCCITSYFWFVAFSEHKTLLDMIGHFNFIPPKVSMSKYTDIPLEGKIMTEMEQLCKGNPPHSIGMLWKDYNKTIQLISDDNRFTFMLFEKFYEKFQNPERLYPNEEKIFVKYIVVLSSDTTLVENKTEHFALIKGK